MRDYLPQLTPNGVRWARFLGVICGFALLVATAIWLREILTPVAAALAIAYILNPLVTWLELRRNIPRVVSVSVGLALLGMALLVFTLHWSVQTVELAQRIPKYTAQLIQWTKQNLSVEPLTRPGSGEGTAEDLAIAELPATQPARLPENGLEPEDDDTTVIVTDGAPPISVAEWRDAAEEYGPVVGRVAQHVTAFIGRQASAISYWAMLAVLVPFYTFFFLLRFNDVVALARDHLPEEYRPTVVRIVTTIDAALADFFRGRVVVSAAVALLTSVGWALIGLENSLLLGVLAGVLNLVPYLSIAALLPALLVAYFGSPDAWVLMLGKTFAVFMVVQMIESLVLTPVVLAQSSGLHPVTTVIALLIGGKVAGLLGMLLAIPIASTLKSLTAEYMLPEVRRLAGRADPPAGPAASPAVTGTASPSPPPSPPGPSA